MGIFRSLGALARAIGPVVSCTGKRSVLIGSPLGLRAKLLASSSPPVFIVYCFCLFVYLLVYLFLHFLYLVIA